MRRREIFDLELGPGRNSREFRAPALPVKLVFNIQCHDTCVQGGNEVLFMKRSRELWHQPDLLLPVGTSCGKKKYVA